MKNESRQIIMKANKTLLIAALAAGSLLVCSPVLRAADTNTPPAGAPPAGQRPPGMRGGNLDQLNLTAEQKPKVQAIMDAQRDKMSAVRQDTSLAPEDRRTKMKAIHDDVVTQMKAVLTPEQFDKWQKYPATLRNRRNGPPPAGENAKDTNAPAAAPQK
jgi:Spy/CpxP family protein refolding chaperone